MAKADLFISYAHEDKEWLERLQKHLRPLLRGTTITAWDDRKIQPGAEWLKEIQNALRDARVAVLLTSADFFDSDFITNHEVPKLIDAAEQGRLRILWIAVRPSALLDTEIAKFQGLNAPDNPLGGLNTAAQEQALVKISREIRDVLVAARAAEDDFGGSPDDVISGGDEPPLPLLRSLRADMGSLSATCLDQDVRIWASNGRRVKIFGIRQEEPLRNWLLPDIGPWKTYLREIWRDRLIVADWSGSLYEFDDHRPGQHQRLYEATHADLPIHRLTVGASGELITAAWNGVIRIWNADGTRRELPKPIALSALPLELMPLSDGRLAIADRDQYVRVFDQAGGEVWKWKADGPLHRVWADEEPHEPLAFNVQVGPDRLLRVSTANPSDPVRIPFEAPVVSISRYLAMHSDEWTVVATDGGGVDWLPDEPFRIVEDSRFRADFAVREIHGIHDPQHDGNTIAVGVTDDGLFFSIRNGDAKLWKVSAPLRHILPDRTGQILFLVSDSGIDVARNPVVERAVCSVEIKVDGQLKVSSFQPVTATFVNTGTTPLYGFRATLQERRNVEFAPGFVSEDFDRQVLPGESFEAEFLINTTDTGFVPLQLSIELEDACGWSESPVKLGFSVQSST